MEFDKIVYGRQTLVMDILF